MPKRVHSSRGKEAGSSSRDTKKLDRRGFLKLVGSLGAATAFLGGLGLWVRDNESRALEQEFIRNLPAEEPELSVSELKALAQEGWLEEIVVDQGPDFIALTQEEKIAQFTRQVGDGLNETLDLMLNSVNPLMRESAQLLVDNDSATAGKENLEGRIVRSLDFLPFEPGKSVVGLLTTVKFDEKGRWYFELICNALFFDQLIQPGVLNGSKQKQIIASNFAHELLGHYQLAKWRIDYWRSQGITDTAQLSKMLQTDPIQEPYAYWRQYNCLGPTSKLGSTYTDSLMTSMQQQQVHYESLKVQGKTWYSSEWVNAIGRFAKS